MLLEYGFKNFFSFREETVISLRLDGKVPEAISGGRHFSTVACIKGANASGKTHALRAISDLTNFAGYSFFWREPRVIPIETFRETKDACELYAEVELDGIRYRYEVEMNDEVVFRETVYRTDRRRTKYFERIMSDIVVAPEEFHAITKSLVIRENVSALSTLRQHRTELLADLIEYLCLVHTNILFDGLQETPDDIRVIARELKNDPETAKFVADFIRLCDTGVASIEIVETHNNKGEPEFVPFFEHQFGDEIFGVHYYAESSGTKSLFRTLPRIKQALDHGLLLIIDELDVHLHPDILPKLVNLFLDTESNPKHAQLIMSAHDDRLMDTLGRYRVHLVNKEQNESYAYRLDEIPGDILRNDRPISPIYSEGKIGGVPKI